MPTTARILIAVSLALLSFSLVSTLGRAGSKGEAPSSWTFEKPSDAELRERLTPLQYEVTQKDGTERAFKNTYWDNKKPGIYVDVVSGEPLFASLHKYESGTGWPSFFRPLEEGNIVLKNDRSLFFTRVEVRSKHADSHLGHVFDDGPAPTGLRYCMNSAALRFVPVERLAQEGYGQYLSLFDKESAMSGKSEEAILAGGCFWGVEDLIREIPGVLDTEVGYTGGTVANATYSDVKTGRSGHAEAVRIRFDPDRLDYADLLRAFFRLHDPTTLNRQGNDRGTQYRSAIFYASPEQKEVAREVIAEVDASGRWAESVVTTLEPAGPFYEAEGYHQDYLVKNPNGYTCHYWRE